MCRNLCTLRPGSVGSAYRGSLVSRSEHEELYTGQHGALHENYLQHVTPPYRGKSLKFRLAGGIAAGSSTEQTAQATRSHATIEVAAIFTALGPASRGRRPQCVLGQYIWMDLENS